MLDRRPGSPDFRPRAGPAMSAVFLPPAPPAVRPVCRSPSDAAVADRASAAVRAALNPADSAFEPDCKTQSSYLCFP